MYVTQSYYTDTYLGALVMTEGAFARMELRARTQLDYFTLNRIDADHVPDAVKNAVCSMIDILYQEEQRSQASGDGRPVVSENTDGYSVTYASASAEDYERLMEKRLYYAAYQHLAQTGLMDWSE